MKVDDEVSGEEGLEHAQTGHGGHPFLPRTGIKIEVSRISSW